MNQNPFSLVRAADFSDEQINELWVEVGRAQVDQIIEPKEQLSKFILGGKGAGKTHLLRYHSYGVARIRGKHRDAVKAVISDGYIAVFLRATGVDAARFEVEPHDEPRWQKLFGIYLELRLAELVVDALRDLFLSSESMHHFNFRAFVSELSETVNGIHEGLFDNLDDVLLWIRNERKIIDDAVNNFAFSGLLDVDAKFSLGGLAICLGRAIPKFCPALKLVPLLYLVDEVENFSVSQQKVINTLIRYSEGHASFRISGRLYSMKTMATIGDGEINREGAEFKTTKLDDIMREWKGYQQFALKFIARRMQASAGDPSVATSISVVDLFETMDKSRFYESAIEKYSSAAVGAEAGARLAAMLKKDSSYLEVAENAVHTLVDRLPPLIQKLNILLFCKKSRKSESLLSKAEAIRVGAEAYVRSAGSSRGKYNNAYGHWAVDLFAQCCREAGKNHRVPYAGFHTFVQMSCNNPRNLLIILGRAYAIAAFRGVDIMRGEKLTVELQSLAALEAAQFMYESDSNFGSPSEGARQATSRLGDLLRTARFSLNIPEVSPLAVSFSDEGLTDVARSELRQAINYSFVYEVADGRPDRNSQRMNRKIRLNPLLAPKWQLPVATRGDIALPAALVNSIFDPALAKNFDGALRAMAAKWNDPFNVSSAKAQAGLF